MNVKVAGVSMEPDSTQDWAWQLKKGTPENFHHI
jgi:hypothetical protein